MFSQTKNWRIGTHLDSKCQNVKKSLSPKLKHEFNTRTWEKQISNCFADLSGIFQSSLFCDRNFRNVSEHWNRTSGLRRTLHKSLGRSSLFADQHYKLLFCRHGVVHSTVECMVTVTKPLQAALVISGLFICGFAYSLSKNCLFQRTNQPCVGLFICGFIIWGPLFEKRIYRE